MEVNQDLVSRRILFCMQALGANQKSFAELLGVTQPAVSKYLKDRIPPAAVLLKLANISGTTIEWILTGQVNRKKLRVAETVSGYGSHQNLYQKLSALPVDLHAHIMALIDSILDNLEKK